MFISLLLAVHSKQGRQHYANKNKETLKRAQEDKMDGSHNPAVQPFLIWPSTPSPPPPLCYTSYLSSLHLHVFLICLLTANFLFVSISFLHSLPTLPIFPCSWQHPSLLQQCASRVMYCACDSDRPHLIITAHTLHSPPSSVSDYNRLHGATSQLKIKL